MGDSLIWDKNGVSMRDLKGAYVSGYENILFAHKGRRELNPVDGQQRHKDILLFNRVPGCRLVHSHQKPVELLEFLIRKSSDEGDLVLVPFCGSGSEVVAAKKLNLAVALGKGDSGTSGGSGGGFFIWGESPFLSRSLSWGMRKP